MMNNIKQDKVILIFYFYIEVNIIYIAKNYMLKRDKRGAFKKIFIVSIVKLDNSKYKVVYYSDRFFNEKIFQGYFLESFISTNLWLFEMYGCKLFNKWLDVEVDIYGNIFSLYYKRRKIDLQANTLRQFSPNKQM